MPRVIVEKMALQGQAIGRGNGSDKVVFLPYANPGDEVQAQIQEEKKHYALGRIVRIVRPGPGRIAPPCPYHFRPVDGSRHTVVGKKTLPPTTDYQLPTTSPIWCGGCDWQHLEYSRQLHLKKEMIRDALERIGNIPNPPLTDPEPSPDRWRYRNKIQVPFGARDGAVVAGFYHPHSHQIVNFEDCLVQPELSVRIVSEVKRLALRYGWEACRPNSGAGWLKHLFLRTNERNQALIAFVTRTPQFPHAAAAVRDLIRVFPEIVGILQNVQPAPTSVILGPRWIRLWGRDKIEERIGKIRMGVSPASFLQVNTRATEKLYGIVEEFLQEQAPFPDTVLDLYSGAGAIALWLAPRAKRVLGVEENRQAVRDALENIVRNRASNVEVLCAKVETALRRLRFEPEALVLDPPRKGCSPEVLKQICRLRTRRGAYVSCDPATFARDARILVDRGWRLKQVRPVDFFPQTSHVELVGLLERR